MAFLYKVTFEETDTLFLGIYGNVSLKVRENTPVMLVSNVSDLEKHFDIKGLRGDAKDF